MRVDWTEEQDFLREAVAGVVSREAQFTTVRTWTESGDLSGADELAARQGWTGIGLDEDAGGQGGGTLELAVLAEQLGRGAVPWDRALAGCLAAPLLAAAGAEELAAATAEGERVAILAVDGRAALAPVSRAPRARGERPDLAGDERGAETLSSTALATVAGEHVTVALRHVLGAPGANALLVPVAAGDAVELLAVDAADATLRPRT